ncbi:MAG: glycosyltransferase family 4 protein [Myxococcota bacterium]|jgi:glycosyltransferase involved in cell wall biosynthesis|nr:glycosyltransferase family 4 protein [Myxococcota bacterium]
MKLCYTNDQIFPNDETDGEQLIQTVSTMARNGAELSFLLPRAWRHPGVTLETLRKRYHVELDVALRTLPSLFPSNRLFEKWGHALRAVLSPEAAQAEVLYTRNIPTLVTALLLSQHALVYETYRNWPDQYPGFGWLFRQIGKQPRFLGAVLHSQFAAQSYRRAGVPDEKLYPRHNGYEPRLLEPVLSKSEAREKLGLAQDRPVLCYSGHVSVAKGIMLVLELAEAFPDCTFIIVGSKEHGEVEQRAATLANVRVEPWMAYRDTLPFLYAADVLIIPPTLGPLQKVGNTVLPIKTFLYMATGRALFAPDSPDLRELLVHRENAYLVPPDDVSAAISGLRELLADQALLATISERAKTQAAGLTYLQRSRDILSFIERRLDDRQRATRSRCCTDA